MGLIRQEALKREQQLAWSEFERVQRLFEELSCTSLIALYLALHFLMVVSHVDKESLNK